MTDTIFTGCRVIDGFSDEPMEHMFVLISDGKISNIGQMRDAPKGREMREVDCSNRTIMPGLIDAHVHLFYGGFTNMELAIRTPVETAVITAALNARTTLAAGYTAIREVGTIGNTSVAIRDAIAAGRIPGPKVVASGRAIGTTASPQDILPPHWNSTGGRLVVDGVDAMRKAVRQQIKEGVDNIKMFSSGVEVNPTCYTWMTTISQEEITAATEEAHRWGRSVAVHAQSYDGIKFALRAGVDTIEHGTRLDDESIELFKKTGAILVPTLCTLFSVVELGDKLKLSAKQRDEMTVNEPLWIESVRLAFKAGVPIAAGGDIGNRYPHGSNARELELLLKAGMSNMEVIKAATSVAARALRRSDRYGALKAGLDADMLVLNANPLDDIKVLQNPNTFEMILKDGQLVGGLAAIKQASAPVPN